MSGLLNQNTGKYAKLFDEYTRILNYYGNLPLGGNLDVQIAQNYMRNISNGIVTDIYAISGDMRKVIQDHARTD